MVYGFHPFLPASHGDTRAKAEKRRELANEIEKVLAKRWKTSGDLKTKLWCFRLEVYGRT
jgi:hypothetical protein